MDLALAPKVMEGIKPQNSRQTLIWPRFACSVRSAAIEDQPQRVPQHSRAPLSPVLLPPGHRQID